MAAYGGVEEGTAGRRNGGFSVVLAATTAAGVVMSASAGGGYLSGGGCRGFGEKAVRGEWSEVALRRINSGHQTCLDDDHSGKEPKPPRMQSAVRSAGFTS